MADYTAINNPELYFQTKAYTGNGTAIGSGGLAITLDGSENMQADWVWLKRRQDAGYHHNWYDSVRGVTKVLYGNLSGDAEGTKTEGLTAFNSNGFTLGNDGDSNASSKLHVAWCWKAGTSVSGTTTGGTGKAYSGSVSTDAGISLITYIGNDNSAHVIPHHLGATPELTIIKERTTADIWVVQNSVAGFGNYMTLHTDSASATTGSNFITSVNSTAVTMNENAVNNEDGNAFMMYSFASKQGYSKIGSYYGNNDTSGNATFIYCGFKPAFIIIKEIGGTGNWAIQDNKRTNDSLSDADNGNMVQLYANLTNADDTDPYIETYATGFKNKNGNSDTNASGQQYLFYAVAEAPLVNSNGIPCNAE